MSVDPGIELGLIRVRVRVSVIRTTLGISRRAFISSCVGAARVHTVW